MGTKPTLPRIVIACVISLLLYAAAFGMILDHPLSLGFLRHEIDMRLARGASIAGPKLVILAGSNAPYSHRCATIEPILDLPCVNGGIAVGVGLDYLFARWKPLLHPGDTVYLPMEEAQYTRGRAETAVGPDAAIMLRHDRTTLSALPPDRWAGALFSINLREALMAPIEMALVAGGFHDPRAAATGETNAWGDHVGHTALLASTSIPILAMVQPTHPDAAQINAGYGTQLIIDFTRWARARGVQVIGGVATGFADSPPPDATTAAIRAVYATGGADFLELPNHSRYPRIAFFDTHEHLNETWQIIHSVALADALVPLLKHHEMRDSLAMAPAPAAHR